MSGIVNGVASGGWNFVIAAYSITAIVLGAYCLRVISAFRSSAPSKEKS
jgi:hypothetical protein